MAGCLSFSAKLAQASAGRVPCKLGWASAIRPGRSVLGLCHQLLGGRSTLIIDYGVPGQTTVPTVNSRFLGQSFRVIRQRPIVRVFRVPQPWQDTSALIGCVGR